jgi:nucleotide-binding universal stress UspA family protein
VNAAILDRTPETAGRWPAAPPIVVAVDGSPAGRVLARARRVLDRALALAERAGVRAEGEVLEGSPGRRIAELARDRDARLVVVGSRRQRLGPSVSRAVVRAAGPSVVVAGRVRFPAPRHGGEPPSASGPRG